MCSNTCTNGAVYAFSSPVVCCRIIIEEDEARFYVSQILVIGATNRKDSLDLALLRPGRFDRTIHMGLPGKKGRLKILQVCVNPLPPNTTFKYPHTIKLVIALPNVSL